MRLFILGATGGIGQLLLKFGLEKGHELTAYVRSPQEISITNKQLKVVQGDLFDPNKMAEFLPKHDAILSAFGPMTLNETSMRQEFGRALTTAMRKSGVSKAQVVSSAFLFADVGMFGNFLRGTFFRQLVPDMARMESEVMKDDLDWTIVRPPRLTNGPVTRKYRVADNELPARGFLISRADVADFMITEAAKQEHVHQIVGLAN